jgi:CheY-like chemotaxis protein
MLGPGMPAGKLSGIRGAIGKRMKSFRETVTKWDESNASKNGRAIDKKRFKPLLIHDVKHPPAKQTDKLGGKLPSSDRDQEQMRTTVKESLPTGKERVLFVDDDDTVVELNQLRLSRLGYEVVATTSSMDALEIFQKEPDAFDLVCTDYAMPNFTGTELAVELLKTKPTIPIILCSGYIGEVSPEDLKEIGIKAFLLKPPGKYEIAETIRRVLDAGIQE